MMYYCTISGIDVFSAIDTVTGITTYSIMWKGKLMDFDDLTSVRRFISYQKLQERQR